MVYISLIRLNIIQAIELGVDFIHGDVYNAAHEVVEDRMWKEEEYTKEVEAWDEARRLTKRPYEVHVHLPDGDIFPITSSIFVIGKSRQITNVQFSGFS